MLSCVGPKPDVLLQQVWKHLNHGMLPELQQRCLTGCLPMRSGHQSFSNSKKINDLVGNIVHSSILVPYHGWRVSHRTHHSNHGHVENDESWHPVTKALYDKMVRCSSCS